MIKRKSFLFDWIEKGAKTESTHNDYHHHQRSFDVFSTHIQKQNRRLPKAEETRLWGMNPPLDIFLEIA